jgi:transposase
LLLNTPPLAAADSDMTQEYLSCMDKSGGVTAAMLECTSDEKARQDALLNHRQLKRRYVLAFFQRLPSCLVGIEACASSHHWSRELQALGHTVRLMPPAYVKPYVKRQKTDMADAEAICAWPVRISISATR